MEKPHIREINNDCYFRIRASPQMCSKKPQTFSQPNVTFKIAVLINCRAHHKKILHPCFTWIGCERNNQKAQKCFR